MHGKLSLCLVLISWFTYSLTHISAFINFLADIAAEALWLIREADVMVRIAAEGGLGESAYC